MENTVYGGKYEATKGMGGAAIAKLIREDIKAAIAAGELPKIKTSVKLGGGRTCTSIEVKVVAVPADFLILNTETVFIEMDEPHTYHPECHYPRFTDAAKVMLKRLEAIHAAYNYNGSSIEYDYHHVRYYGSVGIAGELETMQRLAIQATRRDHAQIARDAIEMGDEPRALAILATDPDLKLTHWKTGETTISAEVLAPMVVGVLRTILADLRAQQVAA